MILDAVMVKVYVNHYRATARIVTLYFTHTTNINSI